MLVSHDRYLLEACAERLWLVADGRVTPFDGDLDDYRRTVLSERGAGGAGRPRRRRRRTAVDVRRAAAEKRAETAPLRQRVAKAESDIANLTRQLRKLDASLAVGDLFTRDPARAAELAKTRANVVASIAAAEEEWLAASSALATA